jgi:hypothetical protein
MGGYALLKDSLTNTSSITRDDFATKMKTALQGK